MDRKSLFRTEAMFACQTTWLGEIVMVRPLSFIFLTTAAVCLAVVIAGFLFAGTYTQRHTVAGRLVPDIGVVAVYAPQSGIVVQKLAREGQLVRQGDILYIVSSERQGGTEGSIQASISDQIAQRERSVRDEFIQTRHLQQGEIISLQRKVEGLQAEQANIAGQIASQQIRMELTEETVKRSGKLLLQGFISKEMMQQKEVELLDQRSRLQAQERDQISVSRELLSQTNELTSLPLRQHNQLAQIERVLTSTAQEWTESEAKRRLAIVAPRSGVVTAITAEAGQTVDGAKPLVSIMPRGATLQVHLYAPSRAIGFVAPNDQVLVRYQAFPYQKFGHARGIVVSVSRTALHPSEVIGMPAAVLGSGEALYRITVKLEQQSVNAYGKAQNLQAGMLVEADILQAKRKLYEWALEPLYSLTGKL